MKLFALTLSAGGFAAALFVQAESNPPSWPASVQVFDPSTPAADIESAVNAAFANNGGHDPANHGQFSSSRYAFLFKPGNYSVDVPVGFYTQVMGLGDTPSDVVFTSERGVYCEEGDYGMTGGALDTFWRSAENFRTQATWENTAGPGMLWAVSQASPLRRIIVDNSLTLYEYQPPFQGAGYASGGYFANLDVGGSSVSNTATDGNSKNGHLRSAVKPGKGSFHPNDGPAVHLGSQQQFFARNSKVSEWQGGVWNVVLAGVDGASPSHCSNENGVPLTNVPTAPLVAEKPFISVDGNGLYTLVVPGLKTDSHGTEFETAGASLIDFKDIYVSQPTDTAEIINSKLAAGLSVVLSPGIYDLDEPLQIVHDNQILLGLGLATLRPTQGTEAVVVGAVDGARVVGIIAQAGPTVTNSAGETATSPALIRFGDPNVAHAGTAANPSFLHDVYCRVGGPDGDATSPVAAEVMVEINNGFVIGDNMWFWRADHTASGTADIQYNPVRNGLVVRGDDVTMYGLAVEHALEDLVQWSGERGRTYFFQSELPYRVSHTYGDVGFCGYRVNSTVTDHDAFGVGVYSNFVVDEVNVPSGIVAPEALESRFIAPLSVYLNSFGSIEHVINDKGAATKNGSVTSYVC